MKALKRLYWLTNRLKADKNLLKSYDDVFKEYLKLDIIEIVDHYTDNKLNSIRYLPHHAVVRSDKTTTKVRPVFNASAKDKNGITLNELLTKGPNMLPNVLDILLRFRLHKIAICADIGKSFSPDISF